MRAAPIVCPEESPLVRPQAQVPTLGGLTRRLRRGKRAAALWGALLLRGTIRRGCRGASGKPPAFLPEYLYPVGFFANYGPKVSKGRAESPLVRPQAQTPAPGGD